MAWSNLKSVFPGFRRIASMGSELGASARSPAAGRGRAHRTLGPPWGSCRGKDQSSTFTGRMRRRCGHTLGPREGMVQKVRKGEKLRKPGKSSHHRPLARAASRPRSGCEQWGQTSSLRTVTSLRDGVPASPLILRWGKGLMTVPSTFGVGMAVVFPEELHFPVTSVK